MLPLDAEYEEIIKIENHAEVEKTEEEKVIYHHDYVKEIDEKRLLINARKYEQSNKKYPYVCIADLTITEKKQMRLVIDGRRCRRIKIKGLTSINVMK